MLTNEEVLEIVICGYEQLKIIANERGITMDELISTIKECINYGSDESKNESRARVRIMEVRELTGFETKELEDEKLTKFFPTHGNNRKNLLNLGKIKIR